MYADNMFLLDVKEVRDHQLAYEPLLCRTQYK